MFTKGMSKIPGSGTKKGQKISGSKLTGLDVIVAELEVKLGRPCDPVAILLELGAGHDALHPTHLVPIAVRLDAAKAAAPYYRAKLSNIEVSGPGGGPIRTTNLNLNRIMSDDAQTTAYEDIINEHAIEARQARDAREAAELAALSEDDEESAEGEE